MKAHPKEPADNHADIAAEFKEYAYSVSHDLSAPVRAMVEFSRLLAVEHAATLNDEGKEYISIIMESGKKLQAMMDGLLAYSRLNSSAKPFTTFDVRKIIEYCRTMMAAQISASDTTFEIGEMPTIGADLEQMVQLFSALIDNAIKYQPKDNKPHIKISAQEKNGTWQFAVSDNGIGIKPIHRAKIFKMFKRLHTDEEYPGVGMGLTLADKIVHRHGGKIFVQDNSPGGSTLHFTIG